MTREKIKYMNINNIFNLCIQLSSCWIVVVGRLAHCELQ